MDYNHSVGKTQGLGCNDSPIDPRTYSANDLTRVGALPQSGKVNMEVPSTNDLCNQRLLGICTACAVRNASEHHFNDGVRLSEYWHYLIQKTKVDGNTTEGSSILNSLKSANKYGVPTKDMESNFPLKVDGTYSQFVQDFNFKYGGFIPQEVLDNASNHRLLGYYSVPISPTSLAREICDGRVLLCRFTVGDNTYRPSWRPEDLFPLRPPVQVDGGHAWCMTEYSGLDNSQTGVLLNSWSRAWGNVGYGSFIFQTQVPYFTEAFAISDEVLPPKPFKFLNNLSYGMTHPDIKLLQKFLNTHGFPVSLHSVGSLGQESNYFGSLTKLAVIRFQQANNIKPAIGNCYEITRGIINNYK